MSDEEVKVTDILRDKIKSKMDVAKFFAGFITLLIGILLKDEQDPTSFCFRMGVVFLIASLGLCVAAMFTYDHLLWPKEHFGFSNDEQQEILFQKNLENQMVRLWKWLFVPAVACFGVGFLLFLLSKLSLTAEFTYKNGMWVFALVIVFVIPIWLCVYKWPHLEKTDEKSAPLTKE